MSREPETTWPIALMLLVVLGLAWLLMQPFNILLRGGGEEDS